MSQPFYESREVIGSSTKHPRTQLALDFARQLKTNRILDLGCGDGMVSAELARLSGANVVCADISELAVRSCRERGLEAHRVEIGEAALPLESDSFDLVLMAEVIEHVVKPDRALDEVRRVLKPRGYLILSTPNLACLPNRVLLAFGIQPLFSEVSEDRVMGRRLAIFGQGGQPVGHLRLYTKRALIEFLESRGFRTVALRGAAFHAEGLFSLVENAIAHLPGLAMIFVVVAQKV